MQALIIVLPLLNSLLCGFLGWYLGVRGCALTSYILMGCTASLSWLFFLKSILFGEESYVVLVS